MGTIHSAVSRITQRREQAEKTYRELVCRLARGDEVPDDEIDATVQGAGRVLLDLERHVARIQVRANAIERLAALEHEETVEVPQRLAKRDSIYGQIDEIEKRHLAAMEAEQSPLREQIRRLNEGIPYHPDRYFRREKKAAETSLLETAEKGWDRRDFHGYVSGNPAGRTVMDKKSQLAELRQQAEALAYHVDSQSASGNRNHDLQVTQGQIASLEREIEREEQAARRAHAQNVEEQRRFQTRLQRAYGDPTFIDWD